MPLNCAELVDELTSSANYAGQLVHHRHLPGRTAEYADLSPPLPPVLQEAFQRQGVRRLYRHQVEAITHVRQGRHVTVVTSTASGKTLCYNAPVLETMLADRTARAFYLFPTKALAHDQLRKLKELELPAPLAAATYDGDTPTPERRVVKRVAQIVLTNPDMLHVGILPNHTTWASFFYNLRYIVVDELHTYQGIFGAHTANIIRRLRRICAHYHATPRFICCSATLSNPGEVAERLLGLKTELVTADTAPTTGKHFLFWNPPLLSGGEAGRRSANFEAVELFSRLLRRGIRSLVFVRARVTAEIVLRYVRNLLKETSTGEERLADKVMSYRAGYLPEERREIERRLFTGELLGVTSTSALELGVDIGGLDAAIIVGYPGRLSSLWQQAGRAGRREGEALVVLVASNSPLDQYLMRHPDYVFDQGTERVLLDPGNIYILAAHLLCAAFELPLADGDETAEPFAPGWLELVPRLAAGGLLTNRGRWFWADADRPHDQVSIRSASGEAYQICDTNRDNALLGTVDEARAFDTVHPGAIYLHRGESYLVTRLDQKKRTAFVQRTEVDYYTRPLITTETSVVDTQTSRALEHDSLARFGQLQVVSQVIGYRRIKQYSETLLATESLDLPPAEFETRGFWIVCGEPVVKALHHAGADLMGSLHAAEHAIIALMPLRAVCSDRDLNGVSHLCHPDTTRPSIFVYDDYPGGAGFAERGYDSLTDLLQDTADTVAACPCEFGCPSCIQSPRCGDGNQPLDKQGAVLLLKLLTGPTPKE